MTVVESLDRIPQYGRCNLSRAVVSRPRLVSRNLNDGGLVDETVERRTLVRQRGTGEMRTVGDVRIGSFDTFYTVVLR